MHSEEKNQDTKQIAHRHWQAIDPHEPAVHGAEYYTDSQQHIVAQAR